VLTLDDFEGTWRIDRVIKGRPMAGTLTGTAAFQREAGQGLICREVGQLTLESGQIFPATRGYHWRAEAARIIVDFEDNTPFHDFTPSGISFARHNCAPDTYDVTYDFTAWPNWTATWEVSGPQKAYRMHTRFGREVE